MTNKYLTATSIVLASALALFSTSCFDDDDNNSTQATSTARLVTADAFIASTVDFNSFTVIFGSDNFTATGELQGGLYTFFPDDQALLFLPQGSEPGQEIELRLSNYRLSGDNVTVTGFDFSVVKTGGLISSGGGSATVTQNGPNLVVPHSAPPAGAFAPDSIGGNIIALTILQSTDGASGTERFQLNSDGTISDIDQPNSFGNFTYTRTGANTAILEYEFSDEEATGEGSFNFTFTSSTGGAYSSQESGVENGVPYEFQESGTFALE